MRNVVLATCLIAIAAVCGVWTSRADSAERVLERALDTSTSALSVRVGDTTWIEGAGVGIPLPPAPAHNNKFPRLLAGEKDVSSSSFWELGPDGVDALESRLTRDGASLKDAQDFRFRPRLHDEEISAQRTGLTFSNGQIGVVVDWSSAGRNYALVVSGARAEPVVGRLEQLLRELIHLPDVGPGMIAPLCFDGRYTFKLTGWQRDGARLHRETDAGLFSLRVFRVPLSDFQNVTRLQLELERRLGAAGFKRSGGSRPVVAGQGGFVGEYFGNDGFVQRIVYAQLDGGYLVALMQAPESARAELNSQMSAMAGSMTLTGLNATVSATPLYFSTVRNIRCLAWQDGRRVLWGAFFDDGRDRPVVWREEGIEWSLQLESDGELIAGDEGEINSSRTLNPLVDPQTRAVSLPPDAKGNIKLTISIGGEKTTTILTIN